MLVMQKDYLTEINKYKLTICQCNCEIPQRLSISFSVLTIYHKFQRKKSAVATHYGKARMVPGLTFEVYKFKRVPVIIEL